MDESGLICCSDIKIKEIQVKIPSFNSVFKFGENYHFITNKGIQTWNYKNNE